MSEPKRLMRGAWVAPMDRPMIAEGGVVFAQGRIVGVGTADLLRRDHPDAVIHDVGNAVILPGLVNAHTHLELSDIRREEGRPDGFVQWLLGLMLQTARQVGTIEDVVRAAVRHGVEQCLKFGVTTVGDISKQCMFSRPALREGPIRVVSYGEIQAMAQRRGLLAERFAAATDLKEESAWLRVGVTPHAPYTVEAEGYWKCLAWAKQTGRPMATHLAETTEEAVFLAEQSGAFRHLWEAGVNAWDDAVPKYAGGPIRLMRELGVLDYPTLLAHVNYCDDEEMGMLARGKASVVYCPRTHAYFGHRPHRWREMLAAGINVAVGTDSCASSPDLDLVAELRMLREMAPEVPAETLWEMGTTRAAKAVGAGDEVGSLSVGKAADVVVFDVTARTEQPLEAALQESALPREVWIGGRRV